MKNNTCKKNPKCPYKDRPKHVFPCTDCKEPKEQYPITCYNCRHHFGNGIYGCRDRRKSIRPCDEFMWD